MANALEVAKYLIQLAAKEPDEPEYLTQMRLHKLLYYVQSWSLAINENPMFAGEIEAWKHGPVVRDLRSTFASYGNKPIPPEEFSHSVTLSQDQKDFVTSVWEAYKIYSATKLRSMTHKEPPWTLARGNCRADDQSQNEITHESMMEYFKNEYRRTQVPGLEPATIARAGEDFAAGRGIPFEDVFVEPDHELSS